MRWQVPIDLTEAEQKLCARLGVRSRFYCFLRRARHLVFDEQFQGQLATMYEQRPSGNPPVPPAMLAMTVLLQAYTTASDAEAIECLKADRRWQMVLDCLDAEQAPFCQKTLAFFRLRLVEMGMDEELLARTVQVAKESRLFDPKKLGKLRVAIDSAPLEGAGRVEDTVNLIGHATRIVVKLVARQLQSSTSDLAQSIGLTIITNSSVKACLDIDWNDKGAQKQAVRKLVSEAETLQLWIAHQAPQLLEDDNIKEAIETLRRVIAQDTEPDPDGAGVRIKQGVAPDRQISLSDPDMRHGRKSSAQRIDGYKRYNASDLDSGLAIAACVLPANVPEQHGADKLRGEIEEHGEVEQLHVDRAFLPSNLTQDVHNSGKEVIAKPYSGSHGELFGKQLFQIDLQARTVQCPAGHHAPIAGERAQFPTATCEVCPSRAQCQNPGSRGGRTITLHPNEPLLQQLQREVGTPEGRSKLRERVNIEHKLAHHCNRQGPRARYRGTRKNDFDARRVAAVNNLLVIAACSHNGEALESMAA